MLSRETILQGRYRIERQLGRGGMGTVYEALDLRFDSQVALKETHFTDDALRKQFEREARLLNKLRHPVIVRVIDYFAEHDGQFLVMDFVDGPDLWEMLQKRRGAFAVEDVLVWGEQLLDALEYLHGHNPPIIHRDIKPQNLKLSNKGQIILLDFGLAKGFAEQLSRVTVSGSVFGYTTNYAPLEQIQGTGTDARSDLYSLGATLYNLITGVAPPDVITRVTATTDGQADPLRLAHEVAREVPEGIATVLNKALAIGRTKRFANAHDMRKALRDLGEQPPVRQGFRKDITSATSATSSKNSANIAHRKTSGSIASPMSLQFYSDSEVTVLKKRISNKWPIFIIVLGSLLLIPSAVGILLYRRHSLDDHLNKANTASAVNASEGQPLSNNSNSSQANEKSVQEINAGQPNPLQEKPQVSIQMGPFYVTINDNNERNYDGNYGMPVTIVTSQGRITKKTTGKARAYVQFDNVPCNERITIIIADYPPKSEGAFYIGRKTEKRYIKCGNPIVNLGPFGTVFAE